MKKSVIAIIVALVVLVAFLGGFLIGRGDKIEPADIAVSDGSSESTDSTPDAPAVTEDTPAGDTEIDESLVPILPEISDANAVLEDPTEDDTLTIVFFGDSQFSNGVDNGTDIPSLVHKNTHARVLNMGIGGTCAALTVNDSNDLEHWDNLSFYGLTLMLQGKASRSALEGRNQLSILEAINPEEVDYYVISYGVNDFLNGIRPHIDGQERIERNYFAALNMGIDNLKSISPKAQYIVCSPCYTQFFNKAGVYLGDSHVHDYGLGVFDEYANQASHVARNRYLFLDAAFDTMFNLNSTNAAKYLSDGIHLTESGRQVYALALSYMIAKDQGWTTQEMQKIDIDHMDWSTGFLADIPAP